MQQRFIRLFKRLARFKKILLFLSIIATPLILSRTYFYLDLPSPSPDPRDINTENISYHSFGRLNFGKVKNILDLIPLLDTILPNYLAESRLCLKSRATFDIDAGGLDQAYKRELDNLEISMVVQQGSISKQIKSTIGRTSCISIMNNMPGNIDIGSLNQPALYSTSTLTGLVSRKLADITKSKIYIWPGLRNVITFTIILFLAIPIIFNAVRDIWYFYAKMKK